VPFRTIAVDPTVIPHGSVLYIPGLRGSSVTLPDGTVRNHDGYVFAGDVGEAVKGNQVDFFIATMKESSNDEVDTSGK
jgi:3D (Asp-Asp-Asp) domain-containing protein